jgi:glycosyltransferase involved in cell wall biosynthesis
MKVLVVDNAYIYRTPDGKYYTPAIYGYDFFQRYLNVFEEVRFAAKTKHVDSIDVSKHLLVSGPNLEIFELPWYQGFRDMIKNIFKLIPRYMKAWKGCDCYIFRVAQIESYLTYIFAKKKPFAVEVVNDPASWDDMHWLFKSLNLKMFKYMINKANGVSYITKKYLQDRYPKEKKFRNQFYFEASYLTLDIDTSSIKHPKKFSEITKNINIVHVSNIIGDEKKGHKTVIDVVKKLIESGYNANVKFIGDGPGVSFFKKYTNELNLSQNINFVGRIYDKFELLEEISKCDLFLFPSHSEGLGRVNIEAQAAGLPCLASNVGGIVELFDNKYLFDPLDVEGFANKIIRLINNPSEMEEMSMANIENAKKYTKEIMIEKRNEFYGKLRKLVENNNK